MNQKVLLILYLLFSLHSVSKAQIFTDSSLPIVIINTDNGVPIVDDPRVLATMKIIYRGPGERNYMTDQNTSSILNYNGRIEIEIRGSSTQEDPKKQYGFTTLMTDNLTNNNVSLLGLAEENDWILNAMVFDPALMRDYICYNLSRQIGEYASGTVYCELIINGDYRGLYLLQEKIKADKNRVNIVKITTQDISLPEISGGYITKADKTTGGDPVAWTMKSWSGASVDFIHELPKPENVTYGQNDYIHKQFTFLEVSALTGNITGPDGFPFVIDVPSFVDYMIISELSSNADSYQFSTYFHKDRNGKLRAGPVWDNDLTFGNDLFFWGLDRSKTTVWQFANGDNEGPRFWRDLFFDDDFRCALSRRWNNLIQPGQPLNLSSLESFIDSTAEVISEAVQRDNLKWANTGDFGQRIQEIKTFLSNRIPWISNNLIPGSNCTEVIVPPLVISKIMYHPQASLEFPENDDMEYLEITNNGNSPIDPEGFFFAGTGFVYVFPEGSVIQPYTSIYLAGNPSVFRRLYGFWPYGRFSRNLSNYSENLVLCDIFGNVIDNVCYFDTIPWPDADGNGYYLKLFNPGLDNNDPASWVASTDIPTVTETVSEGRTLRIYPNPARDMINIESGESIQRCIINDIYGRGHLTVEPHSEKFSLDITNLPSGIYIITFETLNGISGRRFVKY